MKKTGPRKRRVKVGDRVGLRIGARDLVADVVEDRGAIGVGGRRFVAIVVRPENGASGEAEKFDWPAEELTVLGRASAGTQRQVG